jgi:hypothetical protein
MGGLCPLFFDGAVCDFKELPKPNDKESLAKIYNYLDTLRHNTAKSFFSFRIGKNNSVNRLTKVCKYLINNIFNKQQTNGKHCNATR